MSFLSVLDVYGSIEFDSRSKPEFGARWLIVPNILADVSSETAILTIKDVIFGECLERNVVLTPRSEKSAVLSKNGTRLKGGTL